jgi:hypothetical protein
MVSLDVLGDFGAWAKAHGRSYESEEEQERRFKVWGDNREYVNAHNAKHTAGLSTFRMKLNHLADMTHNEYKTKVIRLCVCVCVCVV